MQRQQPPGHWQDNSFFMYLNQHDDDLIHPCEPDCNRYVDKNDNDFDTCRPHSSLAFSPAGRTDMDAFIPTPQNMYAQFSPICATPLNSPDTDGDDDLVNYHDESRSDDKVHVSHARIRHLSRQSVLEDIDEEDCFITCDNLQSNRILRTESNPSSLSSEWKERGDCFLEEESEAGMVGYPAISWSESCSSVQNYESNLQDALFVGNTQFCNMLSEETSTFPGQTSSERRMSFDEFLNNLETGHVTILNQLTDVLTKNKNEEAEEPDMPNSLMQVDTGIKRRETKVANVGRKRKAGEIIQSSPDFCSTENTYYVNRKVCRSENNKPFQCNELNIAMPCSTKDDTSIVDEVGRVPDMGEIIVTSEESSMYDCGLTTNGTRLRHRSMLETGAGGPTETARSVNTSSVAAFTFISPLIDANGNIIPQDLDSHISPWFVQATPQFSQHQTSITSGVGNLPQTGDNQAEQILYPQETTSTTSVPDILKLFPEHLNFTTDVDAIPIKPLESMISSSCHTLTQSSNSHQNELNQNHEVTDEQYIAKEENQSNVTTSVLCPRFLDSQLGQFNSDHAVASIVPEIPVPVTNISMASYDRVGFDSLCNQQVLGNTSVLLNDTVSREPCPPPALNSECSFVHLPEEEWSINNVFQQNSTEQLDQHVFDITDKNTSISDTSLDVYQTASHDTLYSTAVMFDPVYNNHDEATLMADQHGQNGIGSTSLAESSISQARNVSPFQSNNCFALYGQSNQVTGSNANCYRTMSAKLTENTNADDTEVDLGPTIDSHDEVNLSNLSDNIRANMSKHSISVAQLSTGQVVYLLGGSSLGAEKIILLPCVQTEPARSPVEGASLDEMVELPSVPCESETLIPHSSSLPDHVGEIVQLPANADPELIEAHKKFSETGKISALVKHELKCAIKSKRCKEGKADIEVKFEPPTCTELTEEEKEKEKRRRELNRKAAANHRERKKAKCRLSEEELAELTQRNQELKEQIKIMTYKKMKLMEILHCQGITVPEGIASSSSFFP